MCEDWVKAKPEVEEAQNHPYFDKFLAWAIENGCESEYPEDWMIWWQCFLAGAIAATKE